MYWDVVKVKPVKHLTLKVQFSDGLCGTVCFLPSHLLGVFKPLQKADFFSKVFIDHGVVSWPGEIDLAPDAIHSAIKKTGEWVLE